MNLRPRLILALSLALFALPVLAGTPREAILRLVPPDIGYCLVVSDLRSNSEKLLSSSVYDRFRASPLGQSLARSLPFAEMMNSNQRLKQKLGTSWEELAKEVFGDAFILASSPPSSGEGAPSGLLIAHARDEKRVGQLIQEFISYRQNSREIVEAQKKRHAGTDFWQLRKRSGQEEYIALQGAVLIVAEREAHLKQVLDGPKPESSGWLIDRFARLNLDKSPMVLWLSPASFSKALQLQSGKTTGQAGDAFLKAFSRHWDALDDIAFSARTDLPAELQVTIRGRAQALPAESRQLFSVMAAPSQLWNLFPEKALFQTCGRISIPALFRAGNEFLSEEAKSNARSAAEKSLGAAIGRDTMREMVDAIGPDWGVSVTEPEGKCWLPQVTGAMQFAPASAPVREQAIEGLDFLARFTAFQINSRLSAGGWFLKREAQAGVEVRYLDGDIGLPTELKPAFAWKNGYLVIASSPDCIRKFQTQSDRPAMRDKEWPLLRIALSGWANYIRKYRAEIAGFLVQSLGQSADQAKQSIEQTIAQFEVFESVEISQRLADDRAIWTLKLNAGQAPAGDMKKPH